MTAPRTDDLAEREVDLSRWRASLAALWWLPVLGLVLGAIVGVLFSFHGGTSYKASSLISLGQPVSPGGVVIAGFGIVRMIAGSQHLIDALNGLQLGVRADLEKFVIVEVSAEGSGNGIRGCLVEFKTN